MGLRLLRSAAGPRESSRRRRPRSAGTPTATPPLDADFAKPVEVHNPHDTTMIVRIGVTLTQVSGFGPSAQVADWIARASMVSARIVTPDAIDMARLVHDSVATASDSQRLNREAQLEALESRALWLEDRINAIQFGSPLPTSGQSLSYGNASVSGDSVGASLRPDQADQQDHAGQASVALALASEWDAVTQAGSSRSAGVGLDRIAASLDGRGATIELQARTAKILRHLPGIAPAAELRQHAEALREDNVEALIAELEAVDRQGQELSDSLSDSLSHSLPDSLSHSQSAPERDASNANARIVASLFSDAAPLLVIDGDLLDACTSQMRDLLLDRIRIEAHRRPVVLVSDDASLDGYLETVARATLWTVGHMRLIALDANPWIEDPAIRSAAIIAARHVDDSAFVCANHAGSATRLQCPKCRRPYCSLCMLANERGVVECVACALHRGGVRSRRWRSERG